MNFAAWHTSASENLIRASTATSLDEINAALDDAARYEREAEKHITTQRQRALAMGLLHAVDLMRAVAHAEFGSANQLRS